MKTPFKLKGPCIHPACKIYKSVCICGETYMGETIHNVELMERTQYTIR